MFRRLALAPTRSACLCRAWSAASTPPPTSNSFPSSDTSNNLNSKSDPDPSATRNFLLNSLAPNLGIKATEFEAWYRVPVPQLLRHGGHNLLQSHKYSLYSLLKSGFPEHVWDPTIFQAPGKPSLRDSIWKDPKNLRAFMEYLGEKLGLKAGDYSDWYKVSTDQLLNLGARPPLEEKQYSLHALLKAAFPEHSWDYSSFIKSANEFPTQKARDFLLALGKRLNIKEGDLNPWYDVSPEAYDIYGGAPYLRMAGSRIELLGRSFPEHTWHPWLFRYGIRKENSDNISLFGKFLEKELKITQVEDWYRVNKNDISAIHPRLRTMFPRQADFVSFLRKLYPKFKWEGEKMGWSGKGWSQLHSLLDQLFPRGVLRFQEYVPPLELKDAASKLVSSDSDFDLKTQIILVPNWKLVFEYQGPISFAKQISSKPEFLEKTDSEHTKAFSEAAQYTLITVPFWWNRDKDSVLGELFQIRKDLFLDSGPMKDLGSEASKAERISERLSLKEFRMNSGYLRRWRLDPRFQELFSGHFVD